MKMTTTGRCFERERERENYWRAELLTATRRGKEESWEELHSHKERFSSNQFPATHLYSECGRGRRREGHTIWVSLLDSNKVATNKSHKPMKIDEPVSNTQ